MWCAARMNNQQRRQKHTQNGCRNSATIPNWSNHDTQWLYIGFLQKALRYQITNTDSFANSWRITRCRPGTPTSTKPHGSLQRASPSATMRLSEYGLTPRLRHKKLLHMDSFMGNDTL